MPYILNQSYEESATDDFRSLKGKAGHIEKGLFIAESPKIARKILESSIEVPSAFMTEEHFENLRPFFDMRTDTTNIFLASKPEMEKIVGYQLHQGVMLAARIPENRPVSVAAPSWKRPFLAIALNGIVDAENMGAIIRNAAAFGVCAAIVDGQSCNPFLRRSVRVSMGTIVDIGIVRVEKIADALRELKSIGECSIIGASPRSKSLDLADVKAIGNTVIVFGSEGSGLTREAAQACDILARIPMASGVDSLNVAIASGVFLYAMARRKQAESGDSALPTK